MVEMNVEDGKNESCYLYYDGETVAGKVSLHFLFIFRVIVGL